MNIFSIYSEHSDVELLMQQVEKRLQRWENGGELGPFWLTAPPFGRSHADWAQMTHLLNSQWDINGNEIIHSNRPFLARSIILFQQIVRRLTWWYLEPILQQIRNFQRHTAQSVSSLFPRQEAQVDELIEISQQVRQLKKTVLELSQRVATLEKVADKK